MLTVIPCLLLAFVSASMAQSAPSQDSNTSTIQGTVSDVAGKPVGDAVVTLQQPGAPGSSETKSNAVGVFVFSTLRPGSYLLSAEKSGLRTKAGISVALPQNDRKPIGLVLAESPMEFADAPNFTVAGVTDWTAVGGHGSDAILRTSETLARDTLSLKPDRGVAAHDSEADSHRAAAEQDEQHGDPLAAVREYEQAARLDPSERNYFQWGSELLLHRAVWQAQQVFAKGVEAYPKSARMQTALGTALFASARYEDAAMRLCNASDLNPEDPEPYVFMGKIAIVSPRPSACIEQKLARFVQEQPDNSVANYLYAMALLKAQEQSPDKPMLQRVEALLIRAVTLDAKCSDGYLQLGILSSSRHDSAKAIDYYTKAITANPQQADAHYRLGVAYDHSGEPAKAQQEFKLHDDIEKAEAARVEAERREVKQFLIVLQGQTNASPAHP